MDKLKYLSTIEQLAYARSSVLNDGAGRGERIIEVNNGSGLQFTVYPDRALDIVECTFRSINMVYRSCNGARSHLEYQPENIEWLRTWQGGLVTSCGLRSAGVPNEEFGLHGRLSALPAEDVGIVREWVDGKYTIQIRGVIRETKMFGENLRMVRTITCRMGENTIQIDDAVTNLSYQKDYIQLLYHCNFGYPLVAPGSTLLSEIHPVTPRNEIAAAGIAQWSIYEEPQYGAVEQCFFHDLPGKIAVMRVANPALGVWAEVSYDTSTLPRMIQWKLEEVNRYVLGLEPTNCRLTGRTAEIADGTAQAISGGETLHYHVKIAFGS